MMRKLLILIGLFFISAKSPAQKFEKLTLDNIYKNNIFKTKTVRGLRWMKDGNFYTS